MSYIPKYFKPSEFREWWNLMDPSLLRVLDNFRELWGDEVRISPANGALGRYLSYESKSYHNVTRYGKVMAADIMPSFMNTLTARKRAVDCAIKAGAKGIGIYPDWKPSPGCHLDVGYRVTIPTTWSAFNVNGKQTYFPLSRALS